MLEPGTYHETGTTVYSTGAEPLHSMWGLDFIFLFQHRFVLKKHKKRSKQLALAFINTGAGCRVSTVVFGWALDLTESGASATAW